MLQFRGVRRFQFGRQEHLVAQSRARDQAAKHALGIAVGRRGVDQPATPADQRLHDLRRRVPGRPVVAVEYTGRAQAHHGQALARAGDGARDDDLRLTGLRLVGLRQQCRGRERGGKFAAGEMGSHAVHRYSPGAGTASRAARYSCVRPNAADSTSQPAATGSATSAMAPIFSPSACTVLNTQPYSASEPRYTTTSIRFFALYFSSRPSTVKNTWRAGLAIAKFIQRCATCSTTTTARPGISASTAKPTRYTAGSAPAATPVPKCLSRCPVAKTWVASVSSPTARSMLAKMRVCAPAPCTACATTWAWIRYKVVAPNDSRLTHAATPSRYGERISSGSAANALPPMRLLPRAWPCGVPRLRSSRYTQNTAISRKTMATSSRF